MGGQLDGNEASVISADATGDDLDVLDDEDGVTFPALSRGESATIDVAVTGTGGYLQAWIDWDGDNNFTGTNDQIATDLQDDGTNGDTTAGDGVINIAVTVPATATTSQTFARFRWSTTLGLDSTSAASDGEVEDYGLSINAPPVIDLDADDSSGATGTNYQDTFTEGGSAVAISDISDTALTDADDTALNDVTITLTNTQAGDVLRIAGTVVGDGDSGGLLIAGGEVDYFVTELPSGELQILFDSNIAIDRLRAAIAEVTFENTSENPSPVDRIITVVANDGKADSNLATATITVVPVNDPPVIDFDSDDSSGVTGADYVANYTAGEGAVSMTDTDVTITDADDTSLASASEATFTGFVDTGNEIITIGGETFVVGTANVPNFTIGNTTFEVDSDGGDFSISIVSGTGELADWEALFGSITYENTSATPTPGDRELAFTVIDPNGQISNVATSTISVSGLGVLTASKSVAVYGGSATNPGSYALPGEDVVYTFIVENTGSGPVDLDSIELIDQLPEEILFFNGMTPEFGGLVVDWSETSTGLTFTPSTDLSYSNSSAGAPANFSNCGYTPVAGYDANVTYVCFNPKGAMAAGSQFTLSFRAGIN